MKKENGSKNMKACKHFALSKNETVIEPLESDPNSAFLRAVTPDGTVIEEVCYFDFMLDYFDHLLNSEECRNEIGLSKEDVEAQINGIWEKFFEVIPHGH